MEINPIGKYNPSYKYSRTGLVIKHKEDVSPNFS